MLEHYKSLSQDAVALEGNNTSLEAEAADARYANSIRNKNRLKKKIKMFSSILGDVELRLVHFDNLF